MQIKIKKNKIVFILGIVLIIIGIVLFAIPFIINKKEIRIEENKIQKFIDEQENLPNVEIVQEIKNEENNEQDNINYLMVIEIPKIGLKKGIYDIDSKYNKVDYGIQIMKESIMPNLDDSNIILASHRGNSKISFFNKLEKLSNKDIIYIYYTGIKYKYEIVKQYEQDKIGVIKVYKDLNKKTITLITCKKNTNDKQIVFVGNLVGVD